VAACYLILLSGTVEKEGRSQMLGKYDFWISNIIE
jgi:hypothetical protein